MKLYKLMAKFKSKDAIILKRHLKVYIKRPLIPNFLHKLIQEKLISKFSHSFYFVEMKFHSNYFFRNKISSVHFSSFYFVHDEYINTLVRVEKLILCSFNFRSVVSWKIALSFLTCSQI